MALEVTLALAMAFSSVRWLPDDVRPLQRRGLRSGGHRCSGSRADRNRLRDERCGRERHFRVSVEELLLFLQLQRLRVTGRAALICFLVPSTCASATSSAATTAWPIRSVKATSASTAATTPAPLWLSFSHRDLQSRG